jgi:hypothetical protein
LCGLAAEIEHYDAVGRLRLGVGRAIGRWRVEGYLEIGLDLGVIRGKDAMTGVGGLAVDCLAALRSIDLSPLLPPAVYRSSSGLAGPRIYPPPQLLGRKLISAALVAVSSRVNMSWGFMGRHA